MAFISVIFLCVSGNCDFIHSKEPFYSEPSCLETTQKTVKALVAEGATARGTCIPIGRAA